MLPPLEVETFDGARESISLPTGERTVGNLRAKIAERYGWPVTRTRLVQDGEMLDDDSLRIRGSGSEALVRCWLQPLDMPPEPKAPNAKDELWAHVRDAWHDTVAAVRSVPSSTWVGICAWCVSAKLAGRAGFGNPYVLLSLFVLMLRNLGQRRAGELSAYNVFNPNFQELLGQLRLEHLEADIIDPHRLAARQ